VDFNGRFIHVQRNLSRGRSALPRVATIAGLICRLSLPRSWATFCLNVGPRPLRREMEKPAEERQDAATVVNEVMDGWLFQTPVGTQIDPSNLRKLFNRLLTDAKMRRVRFHDLRHTFASLLLQNGESPAYVKEQMGHSSIQVTVDIYGHLVPGGNRQALDKLDDAPVITKKAATA
jgi:integrase